MQGSKFKIRIKVPHTYVLIFSVMLIMAFCTYIIPAGEYTRIQDPATGKMVLDPASFHLVKQAPISFFNFFKAIPNGMSAASKIIFFVFLVAGAFNIILSTGAVEAGIGNIAKKVQGREKILIPIILGVFSIAGATFGMSEEAIVFVPIGVALARALKYDAVVGMAIVALGAACGNVSGMMNPFTVGVAQSIAELPLFSGIGMRIIAWIAMLIITSAYVMHYAKKISAHPELSYVREIEMQEKDNTINISDIRKMAMRDWLVILSIVAGLGIVMFGVMKYEWYLTEISAVFFIMGIVAGAIGGLTPSKMASEFIVGAKGIVFGALVIGFARGILIVMQDGMIVDSIIHATAGFVAMFHKSVAGIMMMLVQVVINFFIPSGSGQASVTMPIMTPLADVVGLTRQTAVLAFQFGDGFTNSIIPTSAVLMANLSMAGIPYEKWVKFIAPLICIWIAMGAVFMVIATSINYGPF